MEDERIDNGVSFREIANKIWYHKYGLEESVELSDSDKGSKEEYIKEQRKNFKEILKCLGIKDIELLKNENKTQFLFLKEDADFVRMIIEEYTKKLVPVRKSLFQKMEDQFSVELVEGLYDLFLHKGYSEDMIQKQIEEAYQKLEYPRRKKKLALNRIRAKIENIVNYGTDRYDYNTLTVMDDMAWLNYVEAELIKVSDFLIQIHKNMEEIKQDELNDMASEYFADCMEKDEDILDKMEQEAQLLDDYVNDMKIKQLDAEEETIKRNSDDKNFKFKECETLKRIEKDRFESIQRLMETNGYDKEILQQEISQEDLKRFNKMSKPKELVNLAVIQYFAR